MPLNSTKNQVLYLKLRISIILAIICFTSVAHAQLPRVTSFTNQTRDSRELMLGDRISVQILGYDSLMLQQNDTGTLVLYLNGIPMTGITAEYNNERLQTVDFHITRCDDNDPWDVFYTSPMPKFWKKELTVSVGFLQTGPVLTTAPMATLVIIRTGYFFISIGCIIIILVLFLYANKKGLLRDASAQDRSSRPFSLSRSQLAFWTMLVSVSYLFIALVTGELAPLTTSTLVLLGISGATIAAAGIIDQNDAIDNNVIRSQDIYKSQGFITDILSDARGVSVHRFQMVVFNFVLGLFFLKQVFTRLEMPEFDNNLLILMGLSNTTYAGLKATENKVPPLPPPPAPVQPPVNDPPPAVPVPDQNV